MQVKSRLYNFIACLKFFLKSHKGAFIYPIGTRRILAFLNTLWRAGFIFGYKVLSNVDLRKLTSQIYDTRPILVHLKTYWYNHIDFAPAFLITLSKAARPRYISNYILRTYYDMRGGDCTQHIVFLISTCYGLITSEEILNFNLKLGGLALCKFL